MSTRKVVFYTFAFFLFVLIVPQLCAQNEIKMSTGEAAISRQKLVDYSKQFIGKPYASGGIGPNSFDCSGLISKRDEGEYENLDTLPVLEFFAALNKETKDAKVKANKVLSNVEFWKEDLTKYAGLEAAVAGHLADIQKNGMKKALADIVK